MYEIHCLGGSSCIARSQDHDSSVIFVSDVCNYVCMHATKLILLPHDLHWLHGQTCGRPCMGVCAHLAVSINLHAIWLHRCPSCSMVKIYGSYIDWLTVALLSKSMSCCRGVFVPEHLLPTLQKRMMSAIRIAWTAQFVRTCAMPLRTCHLLQVNLSWCWSKLRRDYFLMCVLGAWVV